MKLLIRIEELALFLLATYVFLKLENNILLFAFLILLPDISMVGYLVNTKVGALVYNLGHHKAISLIVILIGFQFDQRILLLLGLILFAHSSMDRVLGYGLKYSDSFTHTHLGKIGK